MFEFLAVPQRGYVNMASYVITRMDTFTFVTAVSCSARNIYS
jgi:hypothetical protein